MSWEEPSPTLLTYSILTLTSNPLLGCCFHFLTSPSNATQTGHCLAQSSAMRVSFSSLLLTSARPTWMHFSASPDQTAHLQQTSGCERDSGPALLPCCKPHNAGCIHPTQSVCPSINGDTPQLERHMNTILAMTRGHWIQCSESNGILIMFGVILATWCIRFSSLSD